MLLWASKKKILQNGSKSERDLTKKKKKCSLIHGCDAKLRLWLRCGCNKLKRDSIKCTQSIWKCGRTLNVIRPCVTAKFIRCTIYSFSYDLYMYNIFHHWVHTTSVHRVHTHWYGIWVYLSFFVFSWLCAVRDVNCCCILMLSMFALLSV